MTIEEVAIAAHYAWPVDNGVTEWQRARDLLNNFFLCLILAYGIRRFNFNILFEKVLNSHLVKLLVDSLILCFKVKCLFNSHLFLLIQLMLIIGGAYVCFYCIESFILFSHLFESIHKFFSLEKKRVFEF